MGDYANLYKDVSNQNVDTAELERRKKERYQNRFNYYNSVVATRALILSIIGIKIWIRDRCIYKFKVLFQPIHEDVSCQFLNLLYTVKIHIIPVHLEN